jgi:heptose I phosphotransferase
VIHLEPHARARFEGLRFDDYFALGTELAKASRDGRRRTAAFERGGARYFVKTHAGTGWFEIAKNWLSLKQPVVDARTEARALLRGAELGLALPRLVAFGCEGANPATRRSFVVTEALPESERLSACVARELGAPDGLARRRALVRGLAELVRGLHAAPLAHRDLYLEHVFLARAGSPESPRLFLLDLHRAAAPRRPGPAFVKDLGALYRSSRRHGVTRGDALRFLRLYEPDASRARLHVLFRACARRAR